MRINSHVSATSTLAVLLVLVGVLPSFAQDGKLTIHATPKQALRLSGLTTRSAKQATINR